MPSLEAEKAARTFGSAARISAVPKSHRKPFYAKKNSLGCAYSVTVCVLVSTTIVINHLIFGFSQLAGADMIEGGDKASTNPDYWDPDAGLFKAVFDVGLTFNATSQDAVELQAFAYSQLCQHTPYYPEIDCELQSDQMSVCVVLKCKQFQMSKQAVQMSYMYSIWELWEMQTVEPLPGEPAESISTANVTKEYGKPGAVVLFGFSFVWPHVKLALLHLFFYLPMTSRGRRNGNYWLAVFGKWSFTDVLVCATLVGVFKLTIDSTADKIWQKAAPDLNAACVSACEGWVGTSAPGPKIDSVVKPFLHIAGTRLASLGSRCALSLSAGRSCRPSPRPVWRVAPGPGGKARRAEERHGRPDVRRRARRLVHLRLARRVRVSRRAPGCQRPRAAGRLRLLRAVLPRR